MKNHVIREHVAGMWISTYFETMAEAKVLCRKILKKGGVAICLNTK